MHFTPILKQNYYITLFRKKKNKIEKKLYSRPRTTNVTNRIKFWLTVINYTPCWDLLSKLLLNNKNIFFSPISWIIWFVFGDDLFIILCNEMKTINKTRKFTKGSYSRCLILIIYTTYIPTWNKCVYWLVYGGSPSHRCDYIYILIWPV